MKPKRGVWLTVFAVINLLLGSLAAVFSCWALRIWVSPDMGYAISLIRIEFIAMTVLPIVSSLLFLTSGLRLLFLARRGIAWTIASAIALALAGLVSAQFATPKFEAVGTFPSSDVLFEFLFFYGYPIVLTLFCMSRSWRDRFSQADRIRRDADSKAKRVLG